MQKRRTNRKSDGKHKIGLCIKCQDFSILKLSKKLETRKHSVPSFFIFEFKKITSR